MQKVYSFLDHLDQFAWFDILTMTTVFISFSMLGFFSREFAMNVQAMIFAL